MRQTWPVGTPPPDTFSLPCEVFKPGLKQGPLLIYLYLICRKSLKHGADEMSCAVISKAVGLCEKTVRRHLQTLVDARTHIHNLKRRLSGSFSAGLR